jgi:hypothetical protein
MSWYLISKIADKRLIKRHDLTKPQGVRGRNSDNTRLNKVLGWRTLDFARGWPGSDLQVDRRRA